MMPMATKLGLSPFDLVVLGDHMINSEQMSANGHQTR